MAFNYSQQSQLREPAVLSTNVESSQSYTQQFPILILPDGTLTCTSTDPLATPPTLLRGLQTPTETALFFSQNTFATSISTLPSLASHLTNNTHQTHQTQQPWDLVTKLIITFSSPEDPGGENSELDCLLSMMPQLQDLALIFRDTRYKGRGPASYLRPSLRSILSLKHSRPEMNLRLKVLDYVWGEPTGVESVDLSGGGMRDVTSYLEGMSEEEEREVVWAEGVIAAYRGSAASWVGMLVDCGVEWEEAERVVELMVGRMVRGWVEEEERRMDDGEDVEMG
ncbi:hypothetical protein BKA61DRAFT_670356 [Leptodontidium sp. MPI-SDFR-AT-0119]|nr:hypothetical protein BKA61DRAFT_670356 [Leptodontidium sp. MPI-SDFR-AT-0119]